MKEGNFIKPITDQEAKVLRSSGYGWAVQCGHGSYNQKLVTEDKCVLEFLKEYHNSIRIKTVQK